MIQPNELRIGNWVNAGRVTAISEADNEVILFDGYTSWRSSVMQPDWLQPIPLTPEILEKCGFSKTVTSREGQYLQYGLRIASFDFMFEFYADGEPQFYLDMVGIDILYLHQLQNLAFSISNQELTITL